MTAVVMCLAFMLGQADTTQTPTPPHEIGHRLTAAEEVELAFADIAKQPEDVRAYVRYLSLRPVASNMAMPAAKALAFMIPSSSRAINLDQQVPQRLYVTVKIGDKETLAPTDLYRINLLELEWGFEEWVEVLKNYPYGYTENPIVVRGDWLIHELSDNVRSQAYYLLLYGKAAIPKNAAEFYAFFKVRTDQQEKLGFGLVAQDSPVAVSRERLLEHTAVDGGYAWQTYDLFELKNGEGPLDKLRASTLKYNGTELIVGIPKVSVRQKVRGALQVYQLGDGDGNRVNEAPGRLVHDYVRFKNAHVIVNGGSCIQCHAQGINVPTTNGLEKALLDGVELNAQLNEKLFLERFHLTDVGKEMRRNQEDYAAAVLACNGTDPKMNAALYKATIDGYWDNLTLAQVAREIDSTPEEITAALAHASAQKLEIGVRLAGLTHGRKISRATMETGYLKLLETLTLWRQKK